MSFEKAVEYLGRLGVEFHQDYDYGKQGTETRHRFNVPVFRNFHLPFTADEWCDLCMHEGDFYIGGCCGTTSAAQDILNHVFREGGWVNGKELTEVADLLANHDENPDSPYLFSALAEPLDAAVQHAWERWTEIDPWEKLAVIWHIVRGYISPEVPRAKGAHLSPLDAAISTAAEGLRYLSYARAFKWDEDEDGKPDSQAKARRKLTLAKLLPALKVINEQIESLDPGPFEGFALIDKEKGPDAIAENGMGLCLYETQAQVDDILNLWREQEQEYEERRERIKPVDERIGVRRVRVTKENGVEFLDGEHETPTT